MLDRKHLDETFAEDVQPLARSEKKWLRHRLGKRDERFAHAVRTQGHADRIARRAGRSCFERDAGERNRFVDSVPTFRARDA